MTYRVKEIFFTLQGEGVNAGRPAVFCRFTGCNLWTGREEQRSTAVCRFCDTDFVGTDGPGGATFAGPGDLADAVAATWAAGGAGATRSSDRAQIAPARAGESPTARPLVVCTGGEPLLQLDAPLVEALHERGLEVAIETNGTRPVPPGVDWVCVSPKAGAPLVVSGGDELKLVFPQPGAEPERFASLGFDHFLLQPMDGPDRARATDLAVRYCLEHPGWRLSLQTHKLLGIP